MAPLSGWENFYVVVGSSAGALTGLMFVVITLVAGNAPRRSGGDGELAAYGTPNVVHFCAVLFLAAMLAAPWESLHIVGVLLVAAGIAGAIYASIIARRVIRRASLSDSYDPVLEDWVWFVTLPLVAYGALVVAAFLFLVDPTPALFIIGAAMILLLSIGIHNAWDTVTYLTTERVQPPDSEDEKDGKN